MVTVFSLRVSYVHDLLGTEPWVYALLIVSPGALNTDWDQEGGAKDRLKSAVDSFQLEGLVVNGVRLGAA